MQQLLTQNLFLIHPPVRRNHLLLYVILLLTLLGSTQGLCQDEPNPRLLYFISDCQQPLMLEQIRLKPFRNEEARDSLFADIVRRKPQNLFFLGDLTSKGSNRKSWNPVNDLLLTLRKTETKVHAIPGNHEYYFNATRGIQNHRQQFPDDSLFGYCVKVDSVALVMLNSNFSKLNSSEIQIQQMWYQSMMDSLDADCATKIIITCSHHSPYTNSKVVKPSREVCLYFLPRFFRSPKSKLYISGHSHNLEFFEISFKKHALVIGGGGGLSQPLHAMNSRMYADLIHPDKKPVYFYLIAERKGNRLNLSVRGLQKDFGSVKTFEIGCLD